jgi:hypothetical protein
LTKPRRKKQKKKEDMTMRTKKMAIILILLIGMLAMTAQSLFARGSEVGTGENFLDTLVNVHASGTRIPGTLSIFYVPTGVCCHPLNKKQPILDCMDPMTDMYYSMRASNGKVLYPFSGGMKDVCFLAVETQVAEIKRFISDTVIPIIFQTPPTTNWEIRSITNFVQPDFIPQYVYDGILCCGPSTNVNEVFQFIKMDIEIAKP